MHHNLFIFAWVTGSYYIDSYQAISVRSQIRAPQICFLFFLALCLIWNNFQQWPIDYITHFVSLCHLGQTLCIVHHLCPAITIDRRVDRVSFCFLCWFTVPRFLLSQSKAMSTVLIFCDIMFLTRHELIYGQVLVSSSTYSNNMAKIS